MSSQADRIRQLEAAATERKTTPATAMERAVEVITKELTRSEERWLTDLGTAIQSGYDPHRDPLVNCKFDEICAEQDSWQMPSRCAGRCLVFGSPSRNPAFPMAVWAARLARKEYELNERRESCHVVVAGLARGYRCPMKSSCAGVAVRRRSSWNSGCVGFSGGDMSGGWRVLVCAALQNRGPWLRHGVPGRRLPLSSFFNFGLRPSLQTGLLTSGQPKPRKKPPRSSGESRPGTQPARPRAPEPRACHEPLAGARSRTRRINLCSSAVRTSSPGTTPTRCLACRTAQRGWRLPSYRMRRPSLFPCTKRSGTAPWLSYSIQLTHHVAPLVPPRQAYSHSASLGSLAWGRGLAH